MPRSHKALVYAGADNHLYAYPAGGGAAVWTYKLATGVVLTSPAVSGGVVYFGSTTGTLYALNASTGARICSYNTGQTILGSPVVARDPDGSGPVVYDATVPASANGGEYAIYGPGNRHGACTKDWEFSTFAVSPAGSWASPAYGTSQHGVPLLVFGSRDRDDSVYALNANDGRPGLALPDELREPGRRGCAADHLRTRRERLRRRRRVRDRQGQGRLCP